MSEAPDDAWEPFTQDEVAYAGDIIRVSEWVCADTGIVDWSRATVEIQRRQSPLRHGQVRGVVRVRSPQR